MINDELKNKIEPNLMMELLPHEYRYIDLFFSETYLDFDENGNEVIALSPLPNEYLTMEFSVLTGTFSNMAFWEEVKLRGKKL
ncbi:MAG: hypothetical protein J6V44_03665 [Methanobrevibacter sp.]|nr:hypothetical protein [Methanobrevibacter sp.]